ncbi:hypothetical protein [Fluviispira sanaruensis]|uniref:Uncharacterized protein n=1 Tax=Fluviispira sanaruensis TaxID=2493639 RepID=A0A4P2VNA6_FLUSA|nr:hypothetical protein [Fluviispira sanaruensis]BBH53049.1 hypothetical protein JCM31447_14920 [Fluviispira sanaruensis]
MKKRNFHSIVKFSLSRKFRLQSTALLFLFSMSSCKTSSDNENSVQSLVKVTNSKNANIKTSQDYLLIGAQGRAGKGAVFKCNIDGKNCIEFLGGNIKFKAPDDFTEHSIVLYPRNRFGSSLLISNGKLLIGSLGRDNKKVSDAASISDPNFKEDIGTVFQCNLDGSNCVEFIGGEIPFPKPTNSALKKISLFTSDYFGSSLFALKDKLLIGAAGRNSADKDEIGAVFKCGLDGKNCVEAIAGKNKASKISASLAKYDALGSSIYATNSSLFIGAKNKKGMSGAVFKCNLEGEKCSQLKGPNLKLNENDCFGSSLVGNASSLYIGSMGRNGLPPHTPYLYDIGAVFKCDLNGNNCKEIIGGANTKSVENLGLFFRDYFAASLALSKEYLFIGSIGRKSETGLKTGAVFRCQLDGSNCIELIGGRNKNLLEVDGIALSNDDLFGSSLAIVSMPN